MKHFVLFFAVFIALFFNALCYSADTSPIPSSSSTQPESSIGKTGYTSHYLILAKGMPQSEISETQSAKEKRESDKTGKEIIEPLEDDYEIDEDIETISDPLEPVNRAMFKFNDKLYFWVLKPVSRGYRAVLPKAVRIRIRQFFSNAATPIRLVNCTLQGKMKGVATEATRFTINSTIGIAGFFNPAQSLFHLKKQEAELDQTLCLYGMEPIMYINWPLLGASSLRGTIGFIGDTACDPATYLLSPLIKIGITIYDEVNETSLTIGDYEALTEAALDPYIAVRNAYFQNRKCKEKSQ
jgi:phospholipid-binding lipoprotein MlaA